MLNSLQLSSLGSAVMLIAATSCSDIASTVSMSGTAPPTTFGTVATREPITAASAPNVSGDESTQHDPFTPYDVGPGRHWQYNDLTPAEKAWANKNANSIGWDKVNDAFARAAKERAQQAVSNAALHQLGITDNIAGQGVVP